MKSPMVLLWEKVPEDERRPIEDMYRRWLGDGADRIFDTQRDDWARDCLIAWQASLSLMARETLQNLLLPGERIT